MFRKAQLKLNTPAFTPFYTEPCPEEHSGVCVGGILDWTKYILGENAIPYMNLAFSVFSIAAGLGQIFVIYVAPAPAAVS